MTTLKEHHYVWLKAHPGRDEEWIKTALHAGFDIHHIDGNHENDDPDNLILIELGDHQRIHNGLVIDFHNSRRGKWGVREKRIGLGDEAYTLRISGLKWRDIGLRLYPDKSHSMAYSINVAKMYAEYHDKEWPIPHTDFCTCSMCLKKRKDPK